MIIDPNGKIWKVFSNTATTKKWVRLKETSVALKPQPAFHQRYMDLELSVSTSEQIKTIDIDLSDLYLNNTDYNVIISHIGPTEWTSSNITKKDLEIYEVMHSSALIHEKSTTGMKLTVRIPAHEKHLNNGDDDLSTIENCIIIKYIVIPKEDAKEADKSDLGMVIELAEFIDLGKYVKLGQEIFKYTLQKAKEINENPYATQDEVDMIWRSLMIAQTNLKLI